MPAFPCFGLVNKIQNVEGQKPEIKIRWPFSHRPQVPRVPFADHTAILGQFSGSEFDGFVSSSLRSFGLRRGPLPIGECPGEAAALEQSIRCRGQVVPEAACQRATTGCVYFAMSSRLHDAKSRDLSCPRLGAYCHSLATGR